MNSYKAHNKTLICHCNKNQWNRCHF